MRRQSVVVFECDYARLSASVVEVAGGFEIVSVSHACLPSFTELVSVVLVVRGETNALSKHEAAIKKRYP